MNLTPFLSLFQHPRIRVGPQERNPRQCEGFIVHVADGNKEGDSQWPAGDVVQEQDIGLCTVVPSESSLWTAYQGRLLCGHTLLLERFLSLRNQIGRRGQVGKG
jgi:hypothetical protein